MKPRRKLEASEVLAKYKMPLRELNLAMKEGRLPTYDEAGDVIDPEEVGCGIRAGPVADDGECLSCGN